MIKRRCASCNKEQSRSEMIKITKDFKTKNLIVNPDSLTFGRSAYLCYNTECIENAFKKNRLAKHLKTAVSEELKGQILRWVTKQ